MNRLPPYSVLMPVYAGEKPAYLSLSIGSILRQTAPPDEVVLVADGPLTPGLDEVIDRFTAERPGLFHVVRLPENRGLGEALGEGLRACRNELVARMDSDDIAFPDRCERQLAAMRAHGADIVSAWVEEFSSDDVDNVVYVRRLPETHEEILAFSRRRNPFNHPCVLFRRSAVEAAGGYQPFPLFEDYYLWVRLLRAGAVGYNVPDPLLHMRAGRALYRRRAGVRYLVSMVRFKTYLLRSGYCSWGDYLVSALGHGAVCLMPNALRRAVYKKILRTGTSI